jgi:hypothetical protein
MINIVISNRIHTYAPMVRSNQYQRLSLLALTRKRIDSIPMVDYSSQEPGARSDTHGARLDPNTIIPKNERHDETNTFISSLYDASMTGSVTRSRPAEGPSWYGLRTHGRNT